MSERPIGWNEALREKPRPARPDPPRLPREPKPPGPPFIGGCGSAREKYPSMADAECCLSCHGEQEDFGDLMDVVQDADGWFDVCCKVGSKLRIATGQPYDHDLPKP